MDFLKIRTRGGKKKSDGVSIYPDFEIRNFKDLMARGGCFYAIWNEETGSWSRDEYDVARLVDQELVRFYEFSAKRDPETSFNVDYMSSYSSGSWKKYRQWLHDTPDTFHLLDQEVVFSNTPTNRESYSSKQVPYALENGPCEAYEELMATLYDESEREKLEWAIGSIFAGDSKKIQKFVVLYGEAGSGKSTVLNIIQDLFEGYYATFEASALGASANQFSTEAFKNNPLVAIQHDGDLSKIQDNTKLNSIISHEEMLINEKFKSQYSSRINAFMFIGTNKPVKITDAKSGLIRRLIDVTPSGNKIDPVRYQELMDRIKFEHGQIAQHCINVYKKLGIHNYDRYKPLSMMFKTDVFFNFVEDSYLVFKEQDGVTLKQAYDLYKAYCEESHAEYVLPKYRFREELKNYFDSFSERGRDSHGRQVRSYYRGFKADKFDDLFIPVSSEPSKSDIWLKLDKTESIFDKECSDCPAQYATKEETPKNRWDDVRTTLKDLDTTKLHYVRVPENHIVIDFDLRGEDGEKSAELNLREANKFPKTYAEFSKGGAGVHLHYIYDGDPTKLSRLYSFGVEIKVFTGKSSLRRRLSKCNDLPIAHISSGLPLKGEKMINRRNVQTERGLRSLIARNLRKEIHPGTKPSVDFIKKILDDAYESGMTYDVTDMFTDVLAFANNSTHQAAYCVDLVNQMHFKSEDQSEGSEDYDDDRMVFFDVEVFPNLFLVNWKFEGEDAKVVRMVNPTPQEIEKFIQMKLVGFNCRRYDNHILYARYLGYSNEELYKLSQRIIGKDRNAFFGEAYNISYTDVYDFAAAKNKKSLKKWEIELGIHHQELGMPWDQPVPEERWEEVAAYCDNDVISTEAVFNHLSGDWAARKILAAISGLTVNDTTNQHSTRIIFGSNKHPQDQFVYTDLSEMFPGYTFDHGKSVYRGEEVGEGGYVYAEPGMYTNVGLLDVASMHPTSIEQLNLFGPYTKRFSEIKQGRIDIKHGDWDAAKKILSGALESFVEALESGTASFSTKDLSDALKTVINSVYGLTAASFENPFRDPRNKDNIVAKRGALFMVDLKHACQEKGWTVVHIKTDSIKLANVTPEMIEFVTEFGKKYGYTFEHEATYDKMCIVNDAVYIAHSVYGEHAGEWTATGAQFQHPYIFKNLFSHEKIEFEDLCEVRSVSTALYLDMNESLTVQTEAEKELANRVYNSNLKPGKSPRKLDPSLTDISDEDLKKLIASGHSYIFVGRVGQFCPIKPGFGGGLLVREKDGKYYSVGGSKGYRWLESEVVSTLHKESEIDLRYFDSLVNEAVEDISKYGDFEWFVSDTSDEGHETLWCTNPENNDVNLKQCKNCSECKECAVVTSEE